MADQQGNLYLSGYSGLTHADISAYIGRTLSAGEQTLVTSLITYAELYLCKQCNRNFKASQNYFDIFDAGKSSYNPTNFPILEVQKIELDGSAVYTKGAGDNTIALGTDFFVFDDSIEFETLQQSLTDNRNALKITYTTQAIFNGDAKFALLLWVANFFLAREVGGKIQGQINSAGITEIFTSSVPDYIKSVIASYKKYNL